DAEACETAVHGESAAPAVDHEPTDARESRSDERAARVDVSVDALLAFIPATLDAAPVVAPPAALEKPAADVPVEQAIARVDASVQAVQRLLPGPAEGEPIVQEPAPLVGDVIAEAPAAEIAVDETQHEEVPVQEAPVDEPPSDEPPVEEAIARVDASVDALMRLLPGTV